MASFGSVDIDDQVRWENEFEGADVELTQIHTEEGDKHVYVAKKSNNVNMVLNCGWLKYPVLELLKTMRNDAEESTLILEDSRSFQAILKEIKAIPTIKSNVVIKTEHHNFITKLTFVIIKKN